MYSIRLHCEFKRKKVDKDGMNKLEVMLEVARGWRRESRHQCIVISAIPGEMQ